MANDQEGHTHDHTTGANSGMLGWALALISVYLIAEVVGSLLKFTSRLWWRSLFEMRSSGVIGTLADLIGTGLITPEAVKSSKRQPMLINEDA